MGEGWDGGHPHPCPRVNHPPPYRVIPAKAGTQRGGAREAVRPEENRRMNGGPQPPRCGAGPPHYCPRPTYPRSLPLTHVVRAFRERPVPHSPIVLPAKAGIQGGRVREPVRPKHVKGRVPYPLMGEGRDGVTPRSPQACRRPLRPTPPPAAPPAEAVALAAATRQATPL